MSRSKKNQERNENRANRPRGDVALFGQHQNQQQQIVTNRQMPNNANRVEEKRRPHPPNSPQPLERGRQQGRFQAISGHQSKVQFCKACKRPMNNHGHALAYRYGFESSFPKIKWIEENVQHLAKYAVEDLVTYAKDISKRDKDAINALEQWNRRKLQHRGAVPPPPWTQNQIKNEYNYVKNSKSLICATSAMSAAAIITQKQGGRHLSGNNHYLRVEVMSMGLIAGSGHTFVVLGRPFNTDFSDHTEWGNDFLIIDVWASAMQYGKIDIIRNGNVWWGIWNPPYCTKCKNEFRVNENGYWVYRYRDKWCIMKENYCPNCRQPDSLLRDTVKIAPPSYDNSLPDPLKQMTFEVKAPDRKVKTDKRTIAFKKKQLQDIEAYYNKHPRPEKNKWEQSRWDLKQNQDRERWNSLVDELRQLGDMDNAYWE